MRCLFIFCVYFECVLCFFVIRLIDRRWCISLRVWFRNRYKHVGSLRFPPALDCPGPDLGKAKDWGILGSSLKAFDPVTLYVICDWMRKLVWIFYLTPWSKMRCYLNIYLCFSCLATRLMDQILYESQRWLLVLAVISFIYWLNL